MPGSSPRRRRGMVLGILGVLALVGAVLWQVVAVPALVKYPTDVDVRPQYKGTFRLFVDPAKVTPLAAPIEQPLTIDRHIRVVGSTDAQVTIRETIHQQAGSLVDATQDNQYVMDRRTMKNVASSKAYAFTPDNAVDRSGAYRLQLPFDTTTSDALPVYKNEIGTTYSLNGTTNTYTAGGLTLTRYRGHRAPALLTSRYLAELDKLVPLPASMTLTQLEPFLAAQGVDINATVAALGPHLTPADAAALGSAAAAPVPLEYVQSFDGRAGVERTTGSEVDVSAVETVAVRPQRAAAQPLLDLLGRYQQVPEAAKASAVLTKLTTTNPIPVFENRYAQTPASVTSVASDVADQRRQVLIATRYIPAAIVAIGVVLLLVAAWRMLRGSRA